MKALRRHFDYAGYWLNLPPGAASNSWTGKRAGLEALGFGFLVLFNGRLDAELAKAANAASLGQSDASEAAGAARREGFPPATVIFLDLEEGGRMLPEQKAYIFAWVDGVTAGGFRPGLYCSGIPVQAGKNRSINTAADLREHAGERNIVYWIANDACPPSPGCTLPEKRIYPGDSGLSFAEVWQYAQSPRRKERTANCAASYAADGNCYAPGDTAHKWFIDVNVARTANPSAPRD